MLLESLSILDVTDFLVPDTLLVLDLDNTLWESTTLYGSFEWLSYLIKGKMKEGFTFEKALDDSVLLWDRVQSKVSLKLIEEHSSSWLENLLSNGQKVMGLTGRPKHLAEITSREMQNNNLAFSSFDLSFPDSDTDYYQGVVFVGHKQNKGNVLLQCLEQMSTSYRRIVFVDDQIKYLNEVEEALKGSIEFRGIHFTALKNKARDFDHQKAAQEEKLFQIY